MSNDNSFFKDSVLPLAAGVAAGTIYSKKFTKQTASNFIPVMDPRNNLLNTIQGIKLDSFERAELHKAELSLNMQKLDALQEQGKAAARYERVQAYQDFIGKKTNVFKLNKYSPEQMQALSESVVKREWEAAVQATFPNPTAAKSIFSGSNIFENIKATLKSNQSVLTSRAWNVFEKNISTLQGFSTLGSVNLLNVGSMFPSGYGGLATQKVGINSISNSYIRDTILQIEEALDTKLSASFRGVPGQGEYIFSIAGQDRSLFDLPESFGVGTSSSRGLIRSGVGLQNIYSPGEFGIVNEAGEITERLSYDEFKAKRVLDIIREKRLSGESYGLADTIKSGVKDLLEMEDYREAHLPGMRFNPESIFRNEQLRLVSPSGEIIDDERRIKLAKELYQKGFTPAGAQSRFVGFPTEALYGEFGAQSDFARKPWQMIKEYLPTEQAQQAMKASAMRADSTFDFMNSSLMNKAVSGPAGARLKTLYLSDEQISALSRDFKIDIEDGELLINKIHKKEFEVSRTRRINLFELNTEVAQKLTKEGGFRLENITGPKLFSTPVKVSGILGRSAEGSLIDTSTIEALGISPSVIKTPDGKSTVKSLDLVVRETLQMSDAEKVFGSVKGMARFVKPTPDFLNAISSVTGRDVSELQDIGVFARGDDIKDTARQMNAMVSSLILEGRKAGKPFNTFSLLDEAQSIVAQGGDIKSSLQAFYKSKASSVGLDSSFDFSRGEIAVSQLFFGGPKEMTGAGNITKMDPRLFTLIKSSNPAGMGEDFSKDIISRINKWNPSKTALHGELLKTVESLAGQANPQDWETTIGAKELSNPNVIENLKRKGGFVETGLSKAPRVYIPGYENIPELSPRLVGTGAYVDTSESSKILNSMVRDIRAFNTGTKPFSEAEMLERFEGQGGYLARLTQEVATAGKGAGSIARGEIAGSRALTLLSNIDSEDQSKWRKAIDIPGMNEIQRSRIVGINWNKAQEMFKEMESLYGIEAISSMKSRFQQGELIAGMAMRHPTIGPYSAQPVLFKNAETAEDVMLNAGNRKTFSMISASGEVISKELEIGPLTGWAADKDADTIAAIMMEPTQELKMRQTLLDPNSEFYKTQQKQYMDHSIRMQLLKPKASKTADVNATLAEKAAASSVKLAATQEEVGRISVALTKARTAIMASNLDQASKLQNLSMLEWLEQVPISAKHASVQDVLSGLFQKGLQNTKMGVSGTDPRLLEGAISELAENVSPEFRGLFNEGITLNGEQISGFNVSQRARDIVNSVNEFNSLPRDSQQAAFARFATPSSSLAVSFDDLPNVAMANRLNDTHGAAAKMSRNFIADINNTLSNVVQKAKPFAKPIAIGVGVAAGVSLLMGDSPGTLDVSATSKPMNRPIPSADISGGSRDEIALPPAGQQMGSPSISGSMQQKAYMLEDASRKKSTSIKIAANNISQSQREQLTNKLNNRYPGSQINVNVRDDRKRMNAHSISDIINS